MPDISHKFASAKSDGGDATLVRPSNWNDDHVWPHAYDVETLSLAYGQFEFQFGRIIVSGSNRLTMTGSARIVVFGWFALPEPAMYQQVGVLKTPSTPFRVKTGYEFTVINRLVMGGDAIRGVFEGDCDVILTDDFGSRSRIVLAGRG